MDLTHYRNSEREKARVADLMRLVPNGVETALDIGARDGFVTKLLADRVSSVAALDLEKPAIDDQRIKCFKGDITSLNFANDSHELVLCSEVLEHIPSDRLRAACDELARVSSRYLLIGVPYKQDIRAGRTTCQACGKKNPPWGHVNSFSTSRLQDLFLNCSTVEISFVGKTKERTNFLSCWLMDLAGNPYGTYSQDEPCVHCGASIGQPTKRSFPKRIATKFAFVIQKSQKHFLTAQPNWIHILFKKNG